MTSCSTFTPAYQQTCVEHLSDLYAAYVEVLSGRRARVRMGTRWSEYHPGNADALKGLYMTIYAQCHDPAKCNLPDLSVSTIQRGPPARGCYPPAYSRFPWPFGSR